MHLIPKPIGKMKEQLSDTNILGYKVLSAPNELKRKYSLSEKQHTSVMKGRQAIMDILDKKSNKKLILVGPCSIHSYEEALEYALRLKRLSEKVEDKFLLVMRAYFEKPRTVDGWKGLVYDPDLDGSYDIEKGLSVTRELLLKIADLGLPTATEFLGPWIPQYIDDLISWAAVGARTTESQPHRQMVSGLSMPVGFKNSTHGDVDVALNAIKTALGKHRFLGIDADGRISAITTAGNQYTHIVLRGGKGKPNYDNASVSAVLEKIKAENLPESILIDCSHENTNKNHLLQPIVFAEVMKQIIEGNEAIIGAMLESNLHEGAQRLGKREELKYGVSITDPCIDWKTTERIILEHHYSFNPKASVNSEISLY